MKRKETGKAVYMAVADGCVRVCMKRKGKR